LTKLTELKTRFLEDPETRAEYEALEPEFAIARELIAARTCAGLSQAEVAERMGTPPDPLSPGWGAGAACRAFVPWSAT